MFSRAEFKAKYGNAEQELRGRLETLAEQVKGHFDLEQEVHYLLRNLYNRCDELSRYEGMGFIRNCLEFAEAGETLRILDARLETKNPATGVTQ